MNILLAATTKELLSEHTKVLSDAGTVPGIIDIESLAVANSFALNTYIEEGVYIILNIGAHKTNMVIYGPKAKFFARDLGWAGYNFTKDIVKKMNVSFEEAEKIKREKGLNYEEEKKDTGSLLSLDIADKSTEEQIAQELKRSLRFYVKEAGNSDFRKIVLVGGGAKLKGLPEYLQENLNIETEIFNPFVNLEMPEKFKDKQDPQLALALGLAMRPE
jgi:type IV pilus assembly protein PilM